jgi:amidophosphoribosyltransferase
MQQVIDETYKKSVAQRHKRKEEIVNYVKDIYAPFTEEEISNKIARMLTSDSINAKVTMVFQSIEDLHKACPNHPGDWYFSGNYPTPGGNRVVNNAFINWMEGMENKPYQFSLDFQTTND